jgi:hypothetical protein
MVDAILSKSAFAVHRGVGTGAVSNWIARGKLSGAALTGDGRINVEEADRQLGITVDPGRGAPPAPDAAPPGPEADDVTTSLARVRLQGETLRVAAQERQKAREEREEALERGELLPAAEARRIWNAELDALLADIELFVLELPVKLGQGREGIDIARREWREFRRRRAGQAEVARAA